MIDDELLFLPLGGAGEIGMNLNLYGYGQSRAHTWMMIDLGVTFGDGATPGVDVIMPDPSFIVERRDKLAGLVLTHAHEDHLGAVQHLWPQLRCPIYATPFTLSILRRKLRETEFADAVKIIEVQLGGKFSVGPFDLELVTLTHSIPEPNAIAITTPLGTVLHTGDWKFDPSPVVGPASDEVALRRIGDDGVLAMVCDSTNVFSPGESGSEADLLPNLTELIGEAKRRVAVACFATNVARLDTIARAAEANGRDVVLSGRSLHLNTVAAKENGYLSGLNKFLTEDDAGYLPDEKALIICTGSQGEPRASLARIASGDHPRISLSEGDMVILSARIIPGNERAIGIMHNQLVRRGIRVVTPRDRFIHVSGHPARDELTKMYQLVRPKIAIPVHGEFRHLVEHSKHARACQVELTIVGENGAMTRLAPGPPKTIDYVPVGRLSAEGKRLVPMDSEVFRERIRTMWNGFAVVTAIIDSDANLVSKLQVMTNGLVDSDDNDPLIVEVRIAISEALEKLSEKDAAKDTKVEETIRIATRRTLRAEFDKRPVVKVHLVRV